LVSPSSLVELPALFLPAPQLLQALHQLPVLLPQGGERVRGGFLFQVGGDLGQFAARPRLEASREFVPDLDAGSLAGFRIDAECVHQAPRAHQAKPHAARGAILAVEDGLKVCDAGSLVADTDYEALRHRAGIENEFCAATTGIPERVPRQLGNGGRDAGLVLTLESQQFREAMSALADGNDITLVLDRHSYNWPEFGRRLHGVTTLPPAPSRRRDGG